MLVAEMCPFTRLWMSLLELCGSLEVSPVLFSHSNHRVHCDAGHSSVGPRDYRAHMDITGPRALHVKLHCLTEAPTDNPVHAWTSGQRKHSRHSGCLTMMTWSILLSSNFTCILGKENPYVDTAQINLASTFQYWGNTTLDQAWILVGFLLIKTKLNNLSDSSVITFIIHQQRGSMPASLLSRQRERCRTWHLLFSDANLYSEHCFMT